MFWDLVTGLSLLAGLALFANSYKRIEILRKDVDDLLSMVRVLRYNALHSDKEEEED